MNTSSNFVLTALLGLAIFSEVLPPLWWLGAAMLVAGNVIIGSKDEGKSEAAGEEVSGTDEASVPTSGFGSRGRVNGEDEEDVKDGDAPDLGMGGNWSGSDAAGGCV